MTGVYEKLKEVRRNYIKARIEKQKYSSDYKVEGIIQNKSQMLYVLSGYKPYLWKDVFERIKKFQTEDLEICIASSGKYCEELSTLCKANGWVYISTSLNNICVVSNIVMKLFPAAEYIFKLDEDIYLPRGYFTDMIEAYNKIEAETPGEIGYICPVLPLGFYGMHDFLIRKGCLEEYNERFGKHYLGGTALNPAFRKHVGVDEYIWEKIGNFDECASAYRSDGFSYEPCISRSGIAAILFKRHFWEKMGGLRKPRGKGLGDQGDEGQITSYCALNFQLSYCVKNVLVGHFAFGGSEQEVLKLREKKPEIFELHE